MARRESTNAGENVRLWVAILLLALWGCGRGDKADYTPTYSTRAPHSTTAPRYSFGIFPLHSAVELSNTYLPLMDAINRQVTGFSVYMETARDHPTYEAQLQQRKFDFAMTNQFQAVAAESMGYVIFGKIGGEAAHAVVVVRKDSGVKTARDLRGKAISFSSPAADAAMMAKMALMKGGLNVEKDANPVYVGTLDSVVMHVYSGLAAAGAVWPPTMVELKKQRPEVADAVEVKWSSPPLANVAFVARPDIPQSHATAVANAMFNLTKTEEGRAVLSHLNIPQVVPASSTTYDPVRRFLLEYKKSFGKLPERAGR